MTTDRASDEDLNRFGRKLMPGVYRGAVSKDLLRLNRPGVYVLNLQSSHQCDYEGNGDGTHWTSVLVQPSWYFYFDSFGFPPPKEVSRQLKRKRQYYFKGIAQPMHSDLCGYYDLYAMAAIQSGMATIGGDGELYTPTGKLFFTHVTNNDKRVRLFHEALVNR